MSWSNGECFMLYSTGYSRLFCNFPQSLQANAAMLLQSRPQPLPFTLSPIYYFHIILPIHICHHILEDLYNISCKVHVTEGSPQTPERAEHCFHTLLVTSVSSISWFNIMILVALLLCSLKYTDQYVQTVWKNTVCPSSQYWMWSCYWRICMPQHMLCTQTDVHHTTGYHLSNCSVSIQIPKSWGVGHFCKCVKGESA